MKTLSCAGGLLALAVVAGCATTKPPGHADCRAAIEAAEADLNRAKSRGFGDFVDVVKASSLIVSATAQRAAEKYQGCVEHSQRARQLLQPLL